MPQTLPEEIQLHRPQRVSFLSRMQVMQIGEGVAGSAAGQALWELGADVTVIGGPEPAAAGQSSLEQTARTVLDRGKAHVRVTHDDEHLKAVLGGADLVICDVVDGRADALGVDLRSTPVEDYLALVRAQRVPAWVTISAFGLTGPKAGWLGSELVALAAGGILAHSLDEPNQIPIRAAGSIALRIAGRMAALAGLHVLDLHAEDGESHHADLSAQETVICTGLSLECAHMVFGCPGPPGSGRYGSPSGYFTCREGTIYILVLEEHQWNRLREVVQSPVLDALKTFEERLEQGPLIRDEVERWAAAHTAQECERLLQANGVPASTVNEPADLVRLDEELGRGFFERVDDADGERHVLNGSFLAWQASGDDGDDGSGWSRGRNRLRGLRVLDAGQVLAAPLATSWLGAIGADVTKAEDLSRLDVYRRRGPFADGISGPNRSGYFNASNHSKTRSIAYDSAESLEPLHAAVDDAEVVITNVGARRAKRIGVDPDAIVASNPQALLISSAGFGNTGLMAEYRAYGHGIHSFAGLVALTRDSAGQPVDIGTSWCDPLTGVLIATAAAAWATSHQRGTPTWLDVSMAEMLMSQLSEFFYDPAGALPPGAPDAGPGAELLFKHAPSGRWIAATPASDDSLQRFWTILSECSEAPESGQAGLQDTVRHHGAVRVNCSVDALVARLQADHIAASDAKDVIQIVRDRHLELRPFFQWVRHGELGDTRIVGLPWQLAGEGSVPVGPAPILCSKR